jgi:hypothetical protein
MTDDIGATHTRRRPGNPRLNEQRNTDVTNANRQRILNTDKYSREIFRSLYKFLDDKGPDYQMSEFVEWLATETKHTSPRGAPLRKEGVIRALNRVWTMEQFSLTGDGHEYDIVPIWETIVSLALDEVGLKKP